MPLRNILFAHEASSNTQSSTSLGVSKIGRLLHSSLGIDLLPFKSVLTIISPCSSDLGIFPFDASSSLPYHHSPLLILGSKREFLRSLGPCGGLGSVNPRFPLESLVHSDFNAVAKSLSTKTLGSPFNTFSSASQHSIRLFSFVLCLQGSVESSVTSQTCVVFPRGESPLDPLVECFVVLVYPLVHCFWPCSLSPPFLFCTQVLASPSR